MQKNHTINLFENLGVSAQLLKSLEGLAITTPTEVQEQFLSYLQSSPPLTMQDMVVQAQTGTGKTFAYALPLLDDLMLRREREGKNFPQTPQALIMVPTRELAVQVEGEFQKLFKGMGMSRLRIVSVYGGASYDKQIRELRSTRPCPPTIVVGTPGRVIDMIEKNILLLGSVNTVILDEADEMLNMGFWEDVQTILSSTPEYPERQTWLFSATMPKAIQNVINQHFHSPKMINIKKKTMTNADIEERYFVVPRGSRTEALYRLIESEPDMYGLVFCRTKMETEKIASELAGRGLAVDVLNGDLGQNQREMVMDSFKSRRVRLLVCTDVAARGIDVKNLTHVINIGMSQDNESYVHRIGRTGRAGMKGIALTILDPSETFKIRRLEQFTKRPMIKSKVPHIDQVKRAMIMKELSAISPLLSKIKEKGSEFKVDNTFSHFAHEFSEVGKDEILKLLFSSFFNRKFKRLSDRPL